MISEEVPSSWSPEALKRRRSRLARTRSRPTSAAVTTTCTRDTRSQMYGGVGAETPSTDAAVAATRGQVVTYDGAPV